MRLIRPENRSLQPGLVWLQVVPLLGMVWQFIVITRIAGSIQKEMQAVSEDPIFGYADPSAAAITGKKPTLIPGLLYSSLYYSMAVMIVVTNLLAGAGFMRLFAVILGTLSILTIVCWIVYWVDLAKYKRKLKQTGLAF